ncbi:MAG: T9SS type A sorting domain-containing protein [Candidatus Delongbacteria bacterium]|nr:T9SS type A sorting domain-containing protein [Candidatus Delongbacteria bacterium]MBN2835699.1 T9SS type A sorting domain-containing protein [Candidatus Delongbacteria bacterium]
MKKLMFVLLIFLISSLKAEEWNKIYPLDFCEDIRSSHFFDSQNGIAVGDNGLIIKTEDGGKNWTVIESEITQNLKKVAFTDDVTGYAISDGSIYFTVNAGETWYDLISINYIDCDTYGENIYIGNRFSSDYISIFSNYLLVSEFVIPNNYQINNLTCTENYIYCTTTDSHFLKFDRFSFELILDITLDFCIYDGGVITDLDFANDNLGTLSLEKTQFSPYVWFYGYCFTTFDGGETWDITLETSDGIDKVFFSDENNGWALCGVLNGESKQGGVFEFNENSSQYNYSSISCLPDFIDNIVYEMKFIDANNGYVCCSGGDILHSNDGGLTWSGRDNFYSSPIWKIFSYNDEKIWFSGTDGVYLSTDNGNSWNLCDFEVSSYNYCKEMKIFDDGTGYAFFKDKFYYTTNAGDSWDVRNLGFDYISKSQIIDNSTIYINSYQNNSYYLAKSVNFGQDWITLDYNNMKLIDFNFRNALYGFAIFENETQKVLLLTNDGGDSWIHILDLDVNDSDCNRIDLTDELLIISPIKTNDGLSILLTSCFQGKDIKMDWYTQQISNNTNALGINSFEAIDELTAYCTIYSSNSDLSSPLLKSVDGGYNWEPISVADLYGNINDVHFSSPQTGWFSYKNRIYKTLDGGSSDVVEGNEVKEFSITQNYPNPFNPTTTINFTMPKSGKIFISVFDVNGSTVLTEEINSNMGLNSYKFDGTGLSSGIYYYKIKFDSQILAGKMTLIK